LKYYFAKQSSHIRRGASFDVMPPKFVATNRLSEYYGNLSVHLSHLRHLMSLYGILRAAELGEFAPFFRCSDDSSLLPETRDTCRRWWHCWTPQKLYSSNILWWYLPINVWILMWEKCVVREWSLEVIIGKSSTVHHIWLFAPITGCKWQWMAEFHQMSTN